MVFFKRNQGYSSITQWPMPEAATSEELLDRLWRIRRDGIPGFVVRSSGLVDIGAQSHRQVAEAVVEVLTSNPELGWRPVHEILELKLDRVPKGVGDLHHDAESVIGQHLRVQSTAIGSGKGFLANAGSLDLTPSQLQGLEAGADKAFRKGLVHPALISPEVYSADLGEGDNVIFPIELPIDSHSKAGPIWHRFDTCSAVRQGVVLAVNFE